jgi:hypothetical protein
MVSAHTEKTDISLAFESSLRRHYHTGNVVYSGDSIVIRRTEIGHHFAYADATEFLVSPGGEQVIASIPQGATLEDTCTYFLGPVMGWVLRLHGVVCLHASTIVIGERAVAFCGPPGAGKSTTAAAFSQRGYAVLAEDIAALDDHGGSFAVRPGYPRVNLWPDSAAALRGSADELPAITPNWEKRYLPLNNALGRFHFSPSSLAAIYVIGDRREQPEPEIHPLHCVEALITLASNTYTPYLLDEAMRAREFDVLTRLVKHVPVRSLAPPADISDIGHLCDGILQDYESIS